MDLLQAAKLECCEAGSRAKDKTDILRQLARLTCRAASFEHIDPESIYAALSEREAKGSTGFGGGIAIPHCAMEQAKDFVVAIATVKKGIDFAALDKKKVKIFVSIVGPAEDRTSHLQLLAQVSRILKEQAIRDTLLNADTNIGLYEELVRHTETKGPDLEQEGRAKLMFMVVKDEALMDDLAGIFVEYGIEEVTIMQSQQMENLLSRVPLFLGFFDFTGESSHANRVVMAKIDENRIGAVVKAVEDIVGDLDFHTGVSIQVIDLFYSKGAF